MKKRRAFLSIVLTVALGLGIWTAAVGFTPVRSSFSSGELLSAEELNTLLNDNFDAIGDALDNKLSIASNGNVERNVHFRGGGTGAAVSIKNSGSGHLLQALGRDGYGTAITNSGDILLGPLSVAGHENIRISAEEGTITTATGSGLPVAYGRVNQSGTKRGGTNNWTSELETSGSSSVPRYRITIDDVDYNWDDYLTVVTSFAGSYFANVNAGDGDLIVYLHDSDGDLGENNFQFVTYKLP